jgi:hypothetical protein
MTIPPFDHQGIIPPFLGHNGPGGSPAQMTPYRCSSLEFVQHFSITKERRNLLSLWLLHRAALATAGFQHGFEWVNGSFVEDKDPDDIDVVLFFEPPSFENQEQADMFLNKHKHLFHRSAVKKNFNMDILLCDMTQRPETVIDVSRYYLGLFSHRRDDYLWKGMLQIELNTPDLDAQAGLYLEHLNESEP